MKFQRHNAILELIEKEPIDTQELLLLKLQKRGFAVTQATVSRDIKELHLVKVSTGGQYRYASGKQEVEHGTEARLRNIFRESILSVDFAGNMVVLKTLTGVAMAATAALDAMKIEDIVGSLAGDDTVFLVMRSPEKALNFAVDIKKLIL